MQREDVMALIETLYIELCGQHSEMRLLAKPFRQLTHSEALERYGSGPAGPALRAAIDEHLGACRRDRGAGVPHGPGQ